MKSSTGRWVSGEDFWDRTSELRQLREKVLEHNHVLLTGQRRMGKTSIAREVGRRLEGEGWLFLFVDVKAARSAEDVVVAVAHAARPALSPPSRLAARLQGWLSDQAEVEAGHDFFKLRARLNAGNWRRRGQKLLQACVRREEPILLVIDELPIFLNRMLRQSDGARPVEEFLSWLRDMVQAIVGESLTLVVSGSIGLEPFVRRLGMSDRINYLYPFRLGPWNHDDSVACLERLAENYRLRMEDGVASAVYRKLGIGIPHHVQTFFAHLRDFVSMGGRDRVTVADVDEIYRTIALGPPGQIDLAHYEERLVEALDRETHRISMELLAEAATQGEVTQEAMERLRRSYAHVIPDAPGRVADAISILTHDGYLEERGNRYGFPSNLLRDWWAARFRGHYVALADRR